jgi:hypothetical protein
MFENEELKNHLETSPVIKTQSAIIAEWNMNLPGNIDTVGNYRYRPNNSQSVYSSIPNTFVPEDKLSATRFYYEATDSDVIIDGTFKDSGLPTALMTKGERNALLYSLEDCFKQFRPRSGINKARVMDKSFIHHTNQNMAKRPRFYMADKNDGFKYWSSFRKEIQYKYTYSDSSVRYGVLPTFVDNDSSQTVKNGVFFDNKEYGISSQRGSRYVIDDAVPFVVYKESLPANRVVIKMQTGVGDLNLNLTSDPFYGYVNQKTPTKWKVQYLENNNWIDLISFNEASTRSDGSRVIKSDGYVELAYGLKIPNEYKEIFVYAERYSSEIPLPKKSVNGYAYLIASDNEVGEFYIWLDSLGGYAKFKPSYGWYLQEETVERLTNFVTDLTDPDYYVNSTDGKNTYREFQNIQGLRLVVDSMNTNLSPFDLIELSPRLSVNLTDKTTDFSVKKSLSDLGQSGLPVGQLLSSTGNIDLFDYDEAFNENNPKSIIRKYISRHIQIKFYDVVSDVSGYDYYIPIKTMYASGFPKSNDKDKKVSLELKDLFFYFDSLDAPQTLMTSVSLSSAVSMVLDSIGFANYTFKRVANEKELVIPYFFIQPNVSVAEVLQGLAISTQSAMFFDEYNNFVVMSKDYMLPSNKERPATFTFYGSSDQQHIGAIENATTKPKLANIIDLVSQDNIVYNGGKITYTPKYIQRTYGSIKQASMIDNQKTWRYKPVLLWEVAGTTNLKSINNEVGNMSSYMLSAIPLNSDLSNQVPSVSNRVITNNIIDFGEGVYWISRYNGYFYSGGEVIKYDAVEYNVGGIGNVWISNSDDYNEYFGSVPFNGKIYPTGRVRIYCEPEYETVSGVLKLKNGAVAKHGRGQFGTPVVTHYAGINPTWYDNQNVRGCVMDANKYLFTDTALTSPGSLTKDLALETGEAGVSNTLAQATVRNGIIKNFMSTYLGTETELNTRRVTQAGSIQSSALMMNGPAFRTSEKPTDFISYVYKPLDSKFKHFGTRMRIIGKLTTGNDGQSAVGASTYYVVPGTTPDKNITISGGSGGLGLMLNPSNNNGYYFEISALGSKSIDNKSNKSNVNNVMFYKIMKKAGTTEAVPVKLWEGLANIIVDDGNFTGQYRMANEKNPTVYDLSVEYLNIGTIRRFFLYINGVLIRTVDDESPLPVYNNMALFVRGSSRIMFENMYAISENYSQIQGTKIDTPVQSIFDADGIDTNESFRKYAMSGVIQGTYLSGIGSSENPSHNIYFEEFGTIMREAATFNVKYDKAFPALYAKMSPTFNRIKGYTVSGFRAGSYGAEFMVFNATDTALSLDSGSGNYLRIQGVTFTQENKSELTVDKFFTKNSDFSNPSFNGQNLVSSPTKALEDYKDIKVSRMTYGLKEFSIDTQHIQTEDSATELMSWLVNKISKPRKSIGLKIFAMPIVQLGDIVTIDYSQNGINKTGDPETQYVVYSIDYSKTSTGPDMTVYLSEVS